MANYRFRYNPETLKYERLRISIWNALMAALGVLSFSFLLFVGLLYLQNRFLVSSKKKALLRENRNLLAQQQPVRQQLSALRQQVQLLTEKETVLFARLFSTVREEARGASHAQVLSFNHKEFHRVVVALQEAADQLRTKAVYGNRHFGETVRLLKQDVGRLPYFPTLFPVQQLLPHQLVSGFGNRINPWHKGSYQHDGIDIAQPRGSAVVAAAKGSVALIRRSDLLAGYGNHIEIDHGNGFVTRYAHLGEILVQPGQRLEQGATIARVGLSGSSVAPHVHYEVIWHGRPVDPLLLISGQINARLLAALRKQSKQHNQALD